MGFERGGQSESQHEYDWECGDLAMVRMFDGSSELLAMRGRNGWTVIKKSGYSEFFSRGNSVTSARPLLVTDPDDVQQLKSLAKAVIRFGYEPNFRGPGPRANIEKAVRSLLKQPVPPVPPKPAEPTGLGAVVTDACDVHYVSTGDRNAEGAILWRRQAHGGFYIWDEIDVPDADHVPSQGWSAVKAPPT